MDDRKLLEAKYISPSGKEFTFFWEKVQKKTNLKTGVFPIPDLDGAIVQHQGGGPVQYPMTCIFNDDDHVKIADDFEEALKEKDIAELQHPVYGIKKVIPTGDIERDEDFTEQLNESTVKITFTETITDDKPSKPAPVLTAELEKTYDDFCDTAAADFAASINTDNITEQMSFQSVLENQAVIIDEQLKDFFTSGIDIDYNESNAYSDYITSMTEAKYNAEAIFDVIDSAVNTSADIINNNPLNTELNKLKELAKKINNPKILNIKAALNFAYLTLNILKTPLKKINNVLAALNGYSELAAKIINSYKNNPFGKNNNNNTFALTRLVLAGTAASISTGLAAGIVSKANETGKEKEAAYANVISRETIVNTVLELNKLLNTVRDFEDGKVSNAKNNYNNIFQNGNVNTGNTNTTTGNTGTNNSGNGSNTGTGNTENKNTINRNTKNDLIDSNATAYFTLIELVNLSSQIILNASLSMPMRKTVKLERDRNYIELCAEIYDSVDNYYLDKFVIENNMNIDELEIIPMGREVSYYV
jgi:prophage DNA circulation protein